MQPMLYTNKGNLDVCIHTQKNPQYSTTHTSLIVSIKKKEQKKQKKHPSTPQTT